MWYEHIRCKECSGIIGSFDKGETYNCEKCKREYPIFCIEYDTVFSNPKTGWLFPVITLDKTNLL